MPLVLSAWICTGLAVALVPLYLLRAHWEDQALAGIPDQDASGP